MHPIPGTVTILEGNTVTIAITDLQVFQDHAKTVVDMEQQRALWCAKNPKPSGHKRLTEKETK